MDKIIYAFAWCFSLLPLRVLYLFADCAYVLVFYIVRYRRKLAYHNIRESFPEKSERECKRIEKQFYHYFCDLFVETIKTLTIRDEEMARRFTFENMDLLDDYYANNKSVLLMLGHYGNWEWLTFARMACKPRYPQFKSFSVYHALEGGVMDKFYLRMRSRSGSHLVPQQKLLRALVNQKRTGEPAIYCFIADQGPIWEGIFFWMKWLNHETAPIIGPEKIAKQTGFDVLYIDVEVIRRGYYKARFVKMQLDDNREYELTKAYMRKMEETIRRNPAYWLWTHNRWKRNREGWERLMRSRNLHDRIEAARQVDKRQD